MTPRAWTIATVDPTGTMDFTVYDPLGRTSQEWKGTIPLGGDYTDEQSIVNAFATPLRIMSAPQP